MIDQEVRRLRGEPFGTRVSVHIDDAGEVFEQQRRRRQGVCEANHQLHPWQRSFFPVPESRAAGPVIDDSSTTSGITARGVRRSVLPTPEPPTSISHTASPSSFRFAT